MNYERLTDKIAKHVAAYFDEHPRRELSYHNFDHARYVVKAALKIAGHYELNEEDLFILTAAAWFHDTGYVVEQQGHELYSSDTAKNYLEKQDLPAGVIEKVHITIMATCMPQKPVTLLGQILCDADLYHLAKQSFKQKSAGLRKEIEALQHIEISEKQWWAGTVAFMEAHHYLTDYGRQVLEQRKTENLNTLKAEITATNWDSPPQDEQVIAPKAENKPKKNKDRPKKGIETMFRITSGNNQRLSDMADKKAHILITVNAIILSAIISLVLRQLDENGYLIIPSAILVSISLVSMTFSILATRPNIPEGTFNQNDLDEKKVNLLFFGNFYRMDLQRYTHGMDMVMEDKEFLYNSLIKDVYSQGTVLGKKYYLLRYAYNIFMYGLIVSVAAFIIASLIHSL